MTICRNCGHNLPGDARFCSNCGQPQDTPTSHQEQSLAPDSPKSPPPEQKQGLSRTTKAVIVVIILELPPIGWQLFILGSSQSYSTAFPTFLDTCATRLLAEPLSRCREKRRQEDEHHCLDSSGTHRRCFGQVDHAGRRPGRHHRDDPHRDSRRVRRGLLDEPTRFWWGNGVQPMVDLGSNRGRYHTACHLSRRSGGRTT